MDSIVNRMQKFIELQGLKTSAVERQIKVSNGSLSKPFNANLTIKTDTLEKFLKEFSDISPSWLLTGEGTMLLEETIVNTNVVREESAAYGIPKQSIPLYELEASAGIVSLFNDHNASKPIDYIQVPNLPKCDGALYIVGDSMYPLLKSHDIVIYKMVKELCNHIFVWGEMYLVSWDNDGDDHVVVKWMHKSELGPTHVKLVSENRHHDALDIPVERIRALALVKASIRMNTMS